jgi:hypothetical protein
MGLITRSYQAFLNELLAVESGIRPELFSWYLENMDRPVLSYPKVMKPGRVVRDTFSGSPIYTLTTVREYFERLGVFSLFDSNDYNCLREMQYRSINALGFVGYQIGESILVAHGYYQPVETVKFIADRPYQLPCFYAAALSDRYWMSGRTTAVIRLDSGATVVSTDVNEWRGCFTGKAGLNSLSDLMQPYNQDRLIEELLIESHRELRAVRHDAKKPRDRSEHVLHPDSRKLCNTRSYTLSGLLAAAHLCGTQGVLQFLATGNTPQDEFGTSIQHYLEHFSGYVMPFEEFE